jgi:hypothetical protein
MSFWMRTVLCSFDHVFLDAITPYSAETCWNPYFCVRMWLQGLLQAARTT